MVKVYLNPGKLDEKLATIDKFSDSVRSAYDAIHSYYTNDPIRGDLGSCLATFVSTGDNLLILTGKIKKIKTNIEQLNSSGVTTIDVDGRISLEAPDDSVESPEKFEKWSQGYLDANDISSGKSSLPSGRSFDQVMESMKLNKGDSTYANTFIDRVGPENLTKLGDKDPDKNKEAPIVGEILATASQTWGEEKSKKNADLIIDSAEVDSIADSRVPILNKIMGFHDANRDGVNDLKFGTDFLLSLGRKAEAKSESAVERSSSGYKNVPSQYDPLGGNNPYGLDTFPTKDDPLSGVLDAMTGNEEAARGFLAPNGGNANDVERVKKLIARHKIGDNGWTNTWAGLSSQTAEAHGTDSYDKTTESPESKQAAAITTGVVNTLGKEFKSKGTSCQISDAARSRLSDALSKFPYAVDIAANRPNSTKDFEPAVPDAKDATWAAGMSYQPAFTSEGLAGAIQVVSENTEDLKRVTNSLGYMRKIKTIDAVAHKDTNGAQLERTIENNSTTNAFILGASRARVENDAAKIDDNNQAIIDSFYSGASFLPGPGKNVADIWKKAAEYGKNRSVDVLKGETEEMFTGNLEGAKLTSEQLKKQDNQNSADDSVLQLIGLGAISKDALKNVTLQNSKGESPIDSEGNFDFSKVDSTVREKLWEKFINSNPAGQSDFVNRGLSSGVNNYDAAYRRGHG